MGWAASDVGRNAIDLLDDASARGGQEARNTLQLLAALPHITAPVFLMHAANDYSINPGKALDERLDQLGKAHRLKIYPSIGTTPDEGHDLPLRPAIWEADVFDFLSEHGRR